MIYLFVIRKCPVCHAKLLDTRYPVSGISGCECKRFRIQNGSLSKTQMEIICQKEDFRFTLFPSYFDAAPYAENAQMSIHLKKDNIDILEFSLPNILSRESFDFAIQHCLSIITEEFKNSLLFL